MRILVSFPGRAGDLLWALPTARAISEAAGTPVDIVIAGEFKSMIPMLKAGAPYLGDVRALDEWSLTPPDEWLPPLTGDGYDRVYHLGFRGWPDRTLPHFIYDQMVAEGVSMAPLDLDRPWLTFEPWYWVPHTLVIGWTETWFELKVGLMELLQRRNHIEGSFFLGTPGSRWVTELQMPPIEWLEAARRIANCPVFFGDCSALHVLACAQGKRCVLVEPMESRHNPIFWSFGMDGPRVTCVKGLDGKPTWDARHTADALKAALHG